MSLRKKSTMTPKKISANRVNARRSHGPATPEGRERIRAAHTRHGLYSQAKTVALTCLGEDPAELERLRADLLGDGQLAGALQKQLREHLVEVFWRWKRAGRGQEGFALRLAKDANLTRDDRLHAQMMRLSITAETLRRLAQPVAQKDYVTPREDLEMMKSLHQEGVLKDMGEIALALFYQLQEPGTDENGESEEEKTRRVMAKIRGIFGLPTSGPAFEAIFTPKSGEPQEGPQAQGESDPGTPELADAAAPSAGEGEQEGMSPEEEAHERARQLLENILTRQVEICEAQRQAILKDSLAGPSAYERAAEIALAHPDVVLMQRIEESSFRQIFRVSNLLLKIEKQTGAKGL